MDADSKLLLQNTVAQIEDWLSEPFGNQEPASLYEPVDYILALGGKRVRPLLALLASAMVSGSIKEAKEVAIAVEYLHNFTLMHDDIMDRAESRRGKASVHIKWDESTAILSGDVMFTMAAQWILASELLDSDKKVKLIENFLEITRIVCEGQAFDMDLPKSTSATASDYMKMIEGKTAALIGGSLKLGAIASGASEDIYELFYRIGHDAGLAFQLQDDLLDLTGKKGLTGKKHCGDIYEKKKTWIYLSALKKSNDPDSSFLKNIYAPEHEISAHDVEEVLRIMQKLGIFQECEDIISSYYSKAIQSLESFKPSTFKNALIAFLQSLLKRDF